MYLSRSIYLLLALSCAVCWMSLEVRAQDEALAAESAPAAASAEPAVEPLVELSTEQQQLAARYKRFEEVLLRLAELTAGEDPARAALLRKAVAQSKDRLIGLQFERLIDVLNQDRLATAITNQSEITTDLASLLELLLSEDRAKKIEEEKKRLEAYVKEVNELIKTQKSLQAQTEGRGDTKKLSGQEGRLAERTERLSGEMKSAEQGDQPQAGKPTDSPSSDKPSDDQAESQDGKNAEEANKDSAPKAGENESETGDTKEAGEPGQPSDEAGKPSKPQEGQQGQQSQPGQQGQQGESQESPPQGEEQQLQITAPARERLEAAQQKMREAQRKLDEAKREDAGDKQEEALAELERAKAELEEILRQLREEEIKRMLAMLEARFRAMLEEQLEIYEGTLRLDRSPEESRTRGFEIEAGRLSRRESVLTTEAEKTLTLLSEEGSAVAMPEAVMQMRDDMEQVVVRLGSAKVDELTQGLEEDIIAALEEMIAAIKKAQQEQEQKDSQPPPPPQGEPAEPPLIDKLAELKMIRSLQLRVNKRTERYAKLVDEEGYAAEADLLEALVELSARQQRIHQATRDIAIGRNQ